MSKPRIVLIGAGGHCRSCIDVIEQDDRFEVAGLVGMAEELGTKYLEYEVIGTDDDLPALVDDIPYALITIGQIQSARSRMRLFERILELGYILPCIISPHAYVSRTARVGEGTIVLHRAIINSGVNVGKNCIINSCSLLEHDSSVGDHCHISTGSILNGNTQVGCNSFIGSGSIIKEGISIGNNCVVGMGLSVRHNVQDNTKFIGSPK